MNHASPTLDIGSTAHHALSDDRLKDADNLAFLAGQPADVVAAWLERCRLLREVDELSERDRWELGLFLRAWRAGEHSRLVPDAYGRHAELVHAIGRAWAPSSLFEPDRSLRTWSIWLDALAADYGRSMVPETLEQHDRMVYEVGGFFRLFPFLTSDQWESIAEFGALDQAWNNVRDLAEDAAAGRCYFPTDAITRFGLKRDWIMSGDVHRSRLWADFMTFWLGEHLPALADRARPFIYAAGLHPSVEALLSSSLHRYRRVERVLRGLDWDYRAFPAVYAAEVRREIAERALGAKEIRT